MILLWKRFRDDEITLWIHSDEDANNHLDYVNTTDMSDKIRFTMQTENKNSLQVLNLRPD